MRCDAMRCGPIRFDPIRLDRATAQAAWRKDPDKKGKKVLVEYAALKNECDISYAVWPDGMKLKVPDELQEPTQTKGRVLEKPIWSGEKGGAKLEAKWTRKHGKEWITLWSTKDKQLTQLLSLTGYPDRETGAKVISELGDLYVGGYDKPQLEAEKAKR
eukprot:4979051-Pyramimonas_sp.AAC.1